MINDEMDRAIAEHLGWKFIPCHDDGFGRATGESWRDPDGDIGPFPPSYSTDLNAMHEAEKVIMKNMVMKQRYLEWLGWMDDYMVSAVAICHASASDRAEAFLRTIGKWRDE